MNAGYEVGSSVTVRALHQMPMPGPEGELHAHDYRFDVVVARGQVTALTADGITVKSSDGVSTSFKINGDTRFGFLRQPAPRAELKVGDTVWVAGTRSGDTNTANRIVSAKDLPQGAGGKAGP